MSWAFFLSWGPQCEGEAKIHLCEVNRRFGWTEPALPPPEGAAGDWPQPAAVEWILEARGGNTLVRVVSSGIAAADWANEYHDSIEYGWGFMLVNLRFYLERHRGTPRGVTISKWWEHDKNRVKPCCQCVVRYACEECLRVTLSGSTVPFCTFDPSGGKLAVECPWQHDGFVHGLFASGEERTPVCLEL